MCKAVHEKAKDVYGDHLYPYIAGERIIRTTKVCLFLVVLCCNKRKDLQLLGICIWTGGTATTYLAGILPNDIFHVRGPFNLRIVVLKRRTDFNTSWCTQAQVIMIRELISAG